MTADEERGGRDDRPRHPAVTADEERAGRDAGPRRDPGPAAAGEAERAARDAGPRRSPEPVAAGEAERAGRDARARRRRERRAARAAAGDDALRVCFDARAAGDSRGIGRYVRALLEALERTAGPGEEVVRGHRPRGADVYHSPWIDGAALRSAIPQVVTLHDLVPLKRRAEYLRTGVRFRLRYAAVARAQRIIVPTRAVAEDAATLLAVPRERIDVIGEAPVAAMRPRPEAEVAAVRERYGLPAEYLMWVGGLQHPDPRKRVAALAEAPRSLPLVLVGAARPWAHELARHDVTLTGQVDDDELAAIYTGARALVFPSDEEGFGLPTVEALACGTPVAACDIPVLREVLGDRATFAGRDDLADLVRAAESAERPAPAPPSFTWDDAARATWAVYRAARAGGR